VGGGGLRMVPLWFRVLPNPLPQVSTYCDGNPHTRHTQLVRAFHSPQVPHRIGVTELEATGARDSRSASSRASLALSCAAVSASVGVTLGRTAVSSP